MAWVKRQPQDTPTKLLHICRFWQTSGSESSLGSLEAHSSPLALESYGWSNTVVTGAGALGLYTLRSRCQLCFPGLHSKQNPLQRWDILFLSFIKVASPSAVGGSANELTPVTWAATLGRGTPWTPGLRTDSTPVSLSAKKHTQGILRGKKTAFSSNW